MKHRKTTLTEGNPVKLIVLFAIPIFLGNLFQILYSLIDTKMEAARRKHLKRI